MPQRLELLGTPRLIDTATGEVLLSGVPAAILAFLHVVERPVSRKDLATLFWPGKPERSSRHGLRQALHRIRAATGDEKLDGADPLELESPWFDSDYDACMMPVFNMLSRLPVLAVPAGLAESGVPAGVQIVARTYDDPRVFHVGAVLEATMPWLDCAERRPRLPEGNGESPGRGAFGLQ